MKDSFFFKKKESLSGLENNPHYCARNLKVLEFLFLLKVLFANLFANLALVQDSAMLMKCVYLCVNL